MGSIEWFSFLIALNDNEKGTACGEDRQEWIKSKQRCAQNFYFHFLFLFVWLRLWISWNTEQKPFLFRKWVRSSWSFRDTEKNQAVVCRTNILHHFLFQRMSAQMEVRKYKSEDHAEVRRIFKEGMHENWWSAYRWQPNTQNLTLGNFKHSLIIVVKEDNDWGCS